MDTAKLLRQNDKDAAIIFVTALEDYVFEAFDVGALHYLVKPFDDRKLAEVLARAVMQWKDRQRQTEKPTLMVTRAGEHIAVSIEDIVYAEVFNRKVILHTLDSDIEYYGKMKETARTSRQPHRIQEFPRQGCRPCFPRTLPSNRRKYREI